MNADLIINKVQFCTVVTSIYLEHVDVCNSDAYLANTSDLFSQSMLDVIREFVPAEYVWHLEFIEDVRGRVKTVTSLNQPNIESLNLTVRSTNCLIAAGIYSVSQLLEKTEKDLLRIPNFSKRCLTEIKDVLAIHDLRIKPC